MGVNDQVTISNGNKTGWLLFKKSDSETNSNVLKWSQMALKDQCQVKQLYLSVVQPCVQIFFAVYSVFLSLHLYRSI